MNAALSQHHLLGFEITQLDSITSISFVRCDASSSLLDFTFQMSGSRWVFTPSWLPGSWRSFLYSSSMYACHLFLISSASVRSILLLSFIVHIFAWNIPLVSLIFLKRSLVFHILLFSSISLHWSLRKAFLSLIAILWNSAFRWVYISFSSLLLASLLFSAICKTSSDNHFAFFAFLFLGDGLDHCLLYNVTNLRP